MAAVAEETPSSEEEEELVRRPKSSRKRSLAQSPISDSDTEVEYWKKADDNCEGDESNDFASSPKEHVALKSSTCRSSERLQKKWSQKFHMPSREAVFNRIPSTKSPSKKLDELKPRKLVNDFTKVTSRYNHDPLYTSEESSLEDFIEEDLASKSSGETDCESADSEPKKRQVKTRHKVKRGTKRKSRRVPHTSSSTDSSSDEVLVSDSDRTSFKAASSKSSIKKRKVLIDSSSSDKDTDEETVHAKRRNKKHASLIDSDFSEEDNIEKSRVTSKQDACQKLSDDSETDSEAAEMNRNISMSRQRHRDDDYSSISEDSAVSGEEIDQIQTHDQSRHQSERAQLMEEKRQARRSLIEELKHAKGIQGCPSSCSSESE